MLKKFHLVAGSTYQYRGGAKEDQGKVWLFQTATEDGAKFVHQPLVGSQQQLEVPYDDLKKVKQCDKPAPVPLTPDQVQKLNPHLNQYFERDFQKAQIQAALYKEFLEHLVLVSMFCCLHHPYNL